MTRSSIHFWSAVLVVLLLSWAGSASSATVVIVRPPHPSADLTEALTRIHGELLSVGLDVPMTDRPAADSAARADWRAWLDQVAGQRHASAILDIIVGDDGVLAVDVWVLKAQGRFEVTRVESEPNSANPPGRLAIRALEALRASLLELDLASRERRDQPVVKPTAETIPDREQDKPSRTREQEQEKANGYREQWALEIGAAGLMSLDGVGPAVLPMLSAGWAARPFLVLQAVLAGLGTRPTITTPVATTRVAQQYALLGGCYRFHPQQSSWPFLTIGAGVLRTSLEGQAGQAIDAHTVEQWSFLLDGGLGAGLRVYGRYYLSLAAHVQVAAPYVAIHLVDSVAATSGRPNLLLTLSAGAWP